MKKVSYIDSNLFSPKDAWDALSMAEKSEMMKVAVQNGITNLDDIRREYNEFAGGGYMDKAKALIKKNEGWMAKPYKDAPKGKSWRSVGYGFNDSGFYDKYPEGISRHYENGITKAQAEQELSYILNKADKHLRSIYGKQWDSFNDNQKAAIMDTYYQRPASVGKKSAFYNAVKSGKDASKYLGVKGFADRNKKRQSVFGGGAVPMVADNIDTALPQEVTLQPIVENIPEFIPLNPQAFNTTLPSYQRPELTFEEPVVQEAPVSPYSPEEIERQERAEGLANLGRFLSFTNTSGSNNIFLNTIGMLTGNTFAEGGGIHIKPENRGKFTALKERTGHSATWFKEHGTPAQKKMATFALNARHWKHGFGGNLYDGTSEDSQQMTRPNIFQRPDGSYFYSADRVETDVFPINVLGDNPAQWIYSDALGKIYRPSQALPNSYTLTETEDVNPLERAANNYFRELDWRAKNDPSSIALQGKYTMPLVLSPLLGKGAAAALANPYVDAALTSGFGAHGLQSLANGTADWTTALEIAPLGRLARPLWNAGKEGFQYTAKAADNIPTIKWADAARTPQITAENENIQNESIKDIFKGFLKWKSGNVDVTKKYAELGRQDLLDEVTSPWYKERWKKATQGSDKQIDDLLSYMKTRIEEVPIDYSKTAKQLKDKPGFITHGTTEPRAPLRYKLPNGTPVIDYNTGLDVYVSSDRGKQARGTAYHELQHYLTNNASGTKAFPSLQFIYDGTYKPLSVFTPDGELLIGRGDAWQHYIMDQNDALLPKKSLIYEDAVNNPTKLKDDIIRQGKTSEEADNIISELQDEAQDMMNIQEERAHLKTWFNKEIKPHLNNPNDASEIEQLLKHPNIVKTMPEKVKVLMEKLRPGNIKNYAKYFAESLGVVPFVSNNHLKD